MNDSIHAAEPRRTTVSVVIPTYNRQKDIVRAVQSVLAQTYPPLEVLVVDDGSTDATADVVGAMPEPVRYIGKPNGGVSSARNAGLRAARGDIVALLDSDDAFEPTWLAEAVQALEQDPRCGAVCANVTDVDVRGQILQRGNLLPDAASGYIPLERLFIPPHFSTGSNLCLRRSLLAQIGLFDETMATGEDIDFMLRLVSEAPLRCLPDALILVTKGSGSLSGSLNTGNRLRVLDKFEREHPRLALEHSGALCAARAATALSYACDLTVARRLGDARQRATESWRYEPSVAAAKQYAKIVLLQMLGRART